MLEIQDLVQNVGSFNSDIDQLNLKYRYWIPTSDPQKIIFIHHGFGEHSGRYGHLIQQLHDNKTAFFALDARGHGLSEGTRGHVKNFSEFKLDLKQFIDLISKQYPQQSKILYGHSMGGAVSLDFALEANNQQKINALIVSSPALRIKLDTTKKIKKFAAELLANIAPATVLDAGLNIKDLSHDEKEINAYQNDPLVHGKISFSLGVTFFAIGNTIIQQAKKIKLPLFAFHGTSDNIIDYAGTEDFFAAAGSSDKTLKLYPDLYHEVINESPDLRKKPLQDIAHWIQNTP